MITWKKVPYKLMKIYLIENKIDQKEKMVRNYDSNIQEIWDSMKTPIVKKIGIEEVTEI